MKIGEHKIVRSMTQKGIEYKIFNTTEGYKCNCPAFLNDSDHKCKHIKKYQHLKYKK